MANEFCACRYCYGHTHQLHCLVPRVQAAGIQHLPMAAAMSRLRVLPEPLIWSPYPHGQV